MNDEERDDQADQDVSGRQCESGHAITRRSIRICKSCKDQQGR